ncbi:defender against death DAD protein [Gigaspora margarita]|uniref:Dolichyl-diphosphooligosaccharide--protein glycosyltransferase subunit OST2 n=2 Tax=Gigaspora margarita TaxID=4874 RepID=A0A8H3XIZ8_GIGMA|nr:defender against death DAD protein [Gigaspora margarita]
MSDKVSSAIQKLWTSYSKNTPQSLQLIDTYLVFILFSGVFQFVHCVLVGTFPYNAFLAGFISTVGSFVLAANLRIQTNPDNAGEFKSISPERAFAEFVFCNIVLHFFVVNFIG